MTIDALAKLLDKKFAPINKRLTSLENTVDHQYQDTTTIKHDSGQLIEDSAAIEHRLSIIEDRLASKEDAKLLYKIVISLKHELKILYSWLGDDYDPLSIVERLDRIEQHLGLQKT